MASTSAERLEVHSDPGARMLLHHFGCFPGFRHGYVIGRRCADKEILIHFAATPFQPPNEPPPIDPATGHPAYAGPPRCVTEIDLAWSQEHYKQLSRLLPGGMEVIGFFVIADVDIFESAPSLAVINRLMKFVTKKEEVDVLSFYFGVWKAPIETMDRRLLSTKDLDEKVELKTVRPEPVQYQEKPHKWIKMKGEAILDLSVAIPSSGEGKEMLLKEKIDTALTPLQKMVDSASILFEGDYKKDEQRLDPNAKDSKVNGADEEDAKAARKGKGKGKKSKKEESEGEDEDEDSEDEGQNEEDEYAQGGCKTMEFDMVFEDDVLLDADDCKVEKADSKMRLVGRIALIAYVEPTSFVKDGIAAVKADMMRSLRGRCQMHCDSLVGEDEGTGPESNVPTIHEPPRRISAKIPLTNIWIADYLYPGENVEDSAGSIQELFGFKPNMVDMDDELELITTRIDAILGVSEDGKSGGSATPERKLPKNLPNFAPTRASPNSSSRKYILIAVVVAVLAITVFYFGFKSNEDVVPEAAEPLETADPSEGQPEATAEDQTTTEDGGKEEL